MSYKLIANGAVVDAVIDPTYVRYDKTHKLFLACAERSAQGVASHNESTYWHLDGREDFGVEGYTTVTAVEINRDEALAIIQALDEGRVIPYVDPLEFDRLEAQTLYTALMTDTLLEEG